MIPRRQFFRLFLLEGVGLFYLRIRARGPSGNASPAQSANVSRPHVKAVPAPTSEVRRIYRASIDRGCGEWKSHVPNNGASDSESRRTRRSPGADFIEGRDVKIEGNWAGA